MSEVTIRPIPKDELMDQFGPLVEYAFWASPPLASEQVRADRITYHGERFMLGVFEGETLMAGAGCIPMTQNVRGTIFPLGGIAPVISRPEGRRQGYAREAVKALYKEMHEQGHVFTGLHPFRESFYERMGFVTFPQIRIAQFATNTLAPLLKWELHGTVSMQHIREGYDTYRAFMLEKQQATHGLSYFPPIVASKMRDKEEKWIAIAQHEGQVLGIMIYTITGFTETFKAERFYYSTSQGRYLLLQWIARHIDQTEKVEIELPAYDTAETWLSDMNIKFRTTDWVTAMGRVLDVEKIEGMNVGEGQFVAKIEDDFCPWNNGIFSFSAKDGKLRLTSMRSLPDCTLTIQGLSALVFGTHDLHDFVWRGWAQHLGDSTIKQMSAMFPRALPHMHEGY